jgi:hypothetical protein
VPSGGVRKGHAQVGEFFGIHRQPRFSSRSLNRRTFLADGDRVIVLGVDIFKVKGAPSIPNRGARLTFKMQSSIS